MRNTGLLYKITAMVHSASLCSISGSPVPLAEAPGTITLALLHSKVQAGFPSPAEDLGTQAIDLTAQLVRHPQATFLLRVRGDSMRDAGILDGDVLVVDRALQWKHGHVVVAVVDNEFLCKKLYLRYGRLKLQAANPGFPDIVPSPEQTVEIWGVVAHVIRSLPL